MPGNDSIREWPAAERPRERLKSLGPKALATRELVAILVGSGGKGRSALAVATQVLRRGDGSLRKLGALPLGTLERLTGVGNATACRILAALELGRRAVGEDIDTLEPIRGPEDVHKIMGPILQDLRQEEFHALLVNSQHCVIRNVLITRGILDASLIHPREVFKSAIVESAAGIILVHNHPSGDPSPSAEDRAVTRELSAAGRALGIPVLDHVVIGNGRYLSLSKAGWMDREVV